MRVGPAFVERDGHRYKVSLRVDNMEGWGSVDVSLRRSQDPDGDGPIHSMQRHTWSMVEVRNIFTVSPGLGSAEVETGSKLDPYGTVGYRFSATSPIELGCDGGRRVRRGTVTGKLVLQTHTRLGTIELQDAPAMVWTSNDRCPYVGPFHRGPCADSEVIGGDRTGEDRTNVQVGASWAVLGNRARINIERSRELSLERPEIYAAVAHEIVTHVPRDHAWLRDGIGKGAFRGAAGTFTTGRAAFTASDDRARRTGSSFCNRNGTKYESVERGREGVISGTLKAHFDVGNDFVLADEPLRGGAGRATVHPI